jgi:hypothetical protein
MDIKRALMAIIITLSLTSLAAAQNGGTGPAGAGLCAQTLVEYLDQLPVYEYDTAEIDAASYLREEEKLARDVYLVLSLSWDTPIFSQIARSEQRHMNLVGLLLSRHGLADPVTDDTIGVFANPELGQLFDDLTSLGQQSLADALVVGATIEDLDLADLAALGDLSDELDLDLVVENLAAGSRNHLRAFTTALAANGLTYEAQYLEQWVMDDILASEPERGVVYDELGEVLAECGAQGGNGGGNGGDSGAGNGGGGNGNGGSGNGGAHRGGNGGGTGACDGTGPAGRS